MPDDLFGLNRLERIQRSGIRKIFTPHQPISVPKLFFGRQSEVARIIEAITTPGQHALLYGDRGVGKSSLANYAAANVLKHLAGGRHVEIRCDSSTTFGTVAVAMLQGLQVDTKGLIGGESSASVTSELGGEAGLSFAKAGGKRSETRTDTSKREHRVTPSAVGALLREKQALIVVDEFDALREEGDRAQVAELLKHLSDNGSRVTVLVVGVGGTSAELLTGHPSVQRCLKEVLLGRMSPEELRAIILGNAKAAKLEFAPEVTTEIVSMSAGYPHFTQLLGLKCAEEAVGEGRRSIGREHLAGALGTAVRDAEGHLRSSYEDATLSNNTKMFVHVVRAAADIEDTVFSAGVLRDRLSPRCGRRVEQNELNNHFQRLVGDDDSRILRRVAKGFYRFSDPRMKSYVRMCERAEIAKVAGAKEEGGGSSLGSGS